MVVKSAPDGFSTVTPYIMVHEAEKLLDFMKESFEATETYRTTGSAGGMHAEIRVGDSMLMVGGAPDGEVFPAALYLYVDNVDAVYKRVLQAGATSLYEPVDQPYGVREAGVKDQFGNTWYIATLTK